ncbi:hypothetical protein N0V88_007703 [Collariella sp. IMI 366227]|nr:hypothetical protein N0V88_007703 [Collariella sp. IMI 366227]
MRSRTLQACRPLRAATQTLHPPSILGTRTPSLIQRVRFASSPAYTPVRGQQPPPPHPPAPPGGSSTHGTDSHAGVTRLIDPQVAVLESASVADVDPAFASQIPTPSSSSSSTPFPAFTSAISSPNGSSTSNGIDWSQSFHGLSTTPFSPETAAVLMQPLDPFDIEIKPDGIIYLPEIKYRRILNKAFGPGGFIAQARGECQYFSEETIPTAGEGCKSNALLRCCKDLGIASELWDPRFIREFKKRDCNEVWVEHVVNKKRRQVWTRKDGEPAYPYQIAKGMR